MAVVVGQEVARSFERMPKLDVAKERKSQIVQATVECISTMGYNNFSMQDVARKANVSKGIIHYYFLNKDDLMMAVLNKVASDIEELISQSTGDVEDPARKLEIFVEIGMGIVRTKREYYQVSMDFWTQINQKPEVQSLIANHYDQFRKACRDIIQDGVKSGAFQKVDPVGYSAAIVGMMDGISLQWLFDPERFNYGDLVDLVKRNALSGLVN